MRLSWSLALVAALAACNSEPPVEELGEAPPPGKEDGVGRAGLRVNGNYADTEAWKVVNQWEDRDTPAARQAGLAWGENSGLSWDEKFSAWVGSLESEKASEGWGDTVVLTTPFGKRLQGPRTDCADLAILLRVSFAAWYQLPISLVAGGNPTIYFGHFGVRTASGRWDKAPRFADYSDYSNMGPADYRAAWPKDARLRKLHVGDDTMSFLDAGEGVGAYLDEIHLNKRAARLVWFMQSYLGSRNLADTNNTFNLIPEAVRTGDTLLFRRGTRGTGHTMVVVRAHTYPNGHMQLQDVYGNEPPTQPSLESPLTTQWNFANDEGGGPSQNSDGEVYAKLGGGLKRWRVAKAKGGRWMNTWMNGDEASWIDADDEARIAARPAQFDKLLGEVSFEEKRDALVAEIEAKRAYLREHPASCAARERREKLFTELAALMWDGAQFSLSQTEARYRSVEDYIFPALDYQKSKTCCWNSTTPAMAQMILAYNAEQQQNACVAPTPFLRTDGGYDPFAAYAQKLGRALEWRSWRADEECLAQTDSDQLLDLGPSISWCGLANVPMPAPPTPAAQILVGSDGSAAHAGTADAGTADAGTAETGGLDAGIVDAAPPGSP